MLESLPLCQRYPLIAVFSSSSITHCILTVASLVSFSLKHSFDLFFFFLPWIVLKSMGPLFCRTSISLRLSCCCFVVRFRICVFGRNATGVMIIYSVYSYHIRRPGNVSLTHCWWCLLVTVCLPVFPIKKLLLSSLLLLNNCGEILWDCVNILSSKCSHNGFSIHWWFLPK